MTPAERKNHPTVKNMAEHRPFQGWPDSDTKEKGRSRDVKNIVHNSCETLVRGRRLTTY